MEKVVNKALLILESIFDKGVFYKDAVNEYLNKDEDFDPKDKKQVTSLVLSVLKHDILIGSFVRHNFKEIDVEESLLIKMLFADKLFLNSSANNEIKESLKEKNPELSYSAIQLLDSINAKEELLPKHHKEGSLEDLSFKYNVPLWAIKNWSRNYGLKFTYKILHSLVRPSLSIYRVNTNVASVSSICENKDFVAHSIAGSVLYQGTEPIKTTEEYRRRQVYFSSPCYKYIFDLLDLDPIRGLAIFTDYQIDNILIELLIRSCQNSKFDILAGSLKPYLDNKKYLETFRFKNASIYECKASSTITVLSRKVHTFVMMPRSSDLSKIRFSPDFFVHFDKNSFDELLAYQLESLKECANFVEDGGELVYIVPTMNNKEGKSVIDSFLEENKHFSLVEQKQFFPFDPYGSTLYFALLKKDICE